MNQKKKPIIIASSSILTVFVVVMLITQLLSARRVDVKDLSDIARLNMKENVTPETVVLTENLVTGAGESLINAKSLSTADIDAILKTTRDTCLEINPEMSDIEIVLIETIVAEEIIPATKSKLSDEQIKTIAANLACNLSSLIDIYEQTDISYNTMVKNSESYYANNDAEIQKLILDISRLRTDSEGADEELRNLIITRADTINENFLNYQKEQDEIIDDVNTRILESKSLFETLRKSDIRKQYFVDLEQDANIEVLQEEDDMIYKEIARLDGEDEKVYGEISRLDSEDTTIKNELRALSRGSSSANDSFNTFVEGYNQYVAQTTADLANINSHLSALDTKTDATNTALSETNTNLSTTNDNLATTNTNLSTTNSNLSTTNANLSALSDSVEAFRVTNSQNLTSIRADITALTESLSTTNGDLATTNSNLATTNTNLAGTQTLLSNTITDLTTYQTTNNNNINNICDRLDILEAQQNGYKIMVMTQDQYNALTTKDPTTLYFVTAN